MDDVRHTKICQYFAFNMTILLWTVKFLNACLLCSDAAQGRIQEFLIGGEPNNQGYIGRGTNERSELRAKRVSISWG